MNSSAMRVAATPFYYGWLVLAASAVSEMLAQGATSYAAGLFVLPLQAEFHISRALANTPVLIMFLGGVLVAPTVGRFLDRFSIRWVVSVGAAIFSLALMAIAVSHSLAVMAAILFLPTAIGFMGIGPLTTSTMASRWFYRHRGLALGIAAVATSGGGLIVVPLLSRAIQQYGWRMGLFYEAIAIGVIIIGLALLILRDSPFDVALGEHPENRGRRQAEALSSGGETGMRSTLRWQDILGSRAFWLPALVLATVSGTSQALVVTLVPYGVGLGFAAASAAGLISAFAIAAAITKVSAGVLADHISQRALLIAAAAFMTLSWLSLSFSANYWALFASACLGGIGLGCALPTTAALIAAHFGAARFGAVMGWAYALLGAFTIAASLSIGFLFDRTGSYHFAFLAFSLILACLLIGTLFFAPERSEAAKIAD
jgi:MFS family permease